MYAALFITCIHYNVPIYINNLIIPWWIPVNETLDNEIDMQSRAESEMRLEVHWLSDKIKMYSIKQKLNLTLLVTKGIYVWRCSCPIETGS